MRTFATRVFFLSVAIVVSGMQRAAADDSVDVQRIKTPRGEIIEVATVIPPGQGPFPAVIIGSGQGYDMRQPLMKQLTVELQKRNIAVYRFNWAYWLKTRKPGGQSADRKAEIEDYTTVLTLARNEPRVDRQRIVLAGKSLGSIIAWRVFRSAPEAKAAVLLTPVCTKPGPEVTTADTIYPEFTEEKRSSAWILGNADPLCKVTEIQRFVAQTKGQARLDVLRGGHTFEEGGRSNPASAGKTASNINEAVKTAVDFIDTVVKR